MDFGRLPEEELAKTDFSLVTDPALNREVLKGKSPKLPKIYIGCVRWSYKEWIGKVYPQGLTEANFLKEYVNQYNCVELNATHYKLYTPVDIQKWTAKAKDTDFLFCPKLYKGITHAGSLTGMQALTTTFLEGVLAFGKHLGPIFIQVSDAFSPNRKEELFAYLEALPKDLTFFLEVRHPDWFTETGSTELFTRLGTLHTGAVITDTAGRRDCCHMHLSIPKTFVRFIANGQHPTDYKRLDDWADQIHYWLENGLEELYFFIHLHHEAFLPQLTVYLMDKLHAKCGLPLKKPTFIPTLF